MGLTSMISAPSNFPSSKRPYRKRQENRTRYPQFSTTKAVIYLQVQSLGTSSFGISPPGAPLNRFLFEVSTPLQRLTVSDAALFAEKKHVLALDIFQRVHDGRKVSFVVGGVTGPTSHPSIVVWKAEDIRAKGMSAALWWSISHACLRRDQQTDDCQSFQLDDICKYLTHHTQ